MVRALCLGLLALALVSGCGGYASTSEAFRKTMTAGRPEQALAAVNKAMDVSRAEDLPKETSGDNALLLLERATILQAMGRNDLSARDFQTADKNIEVIDFTSDTAGSIGKWVYSDDAGVYRTPPHEKLLINTLNLINYLVRADVSGAKVEARRFQVNQKYFKGKEGDGVDRGAAMMALSSFLAGFAFEMDANPQEAMRYYADAAESGGVPGLPDAARRLAARTGVTDDRLKDVLATPATLAPDDAQQGEVLVVVQVGMAPYKFPERLPIGAAVVIATAPGPGARLSPAEQRRANEFALKGLLKWVNFPRMKRSTKSRWSNVAVTLDDKTPVPGGEALDIEERVIKTFEAIEGSIVASAIVRMITRAVAGEATNAVARKASGSGAVGLLAGLVLEGAMTAADTPDTRSWVTLPSRIFVARTRVAPGRHTLNVRMGGFNRAAAVDVAPGGFAVLNFSDYR